MQSTVALSYDTQLKMSIDAWLVSVSLEHDLSYETIETHLRTILQKRKFAHADFTEHTLQNIIQVTRIEPDVLIGAFLKQANKN